MSSMPSFGSLAMPSDSPKPPPSKASKGQGQAATSMPQFLDDDLQLSESDDDEFD